MIIKNKFLMFILFFVLLINVNISNAYRRSRFNSTMINRYKRMLIKNPYDKFSFKKLTTLYSNYRNINLLMKFYKSGTSTYEKKVILGRLHILKKEFKKGNKILLESIKSKPIRFEAYYFLGELHKQSGKHKKSEEYFSKSLKLISKKYIKISILKELLKLTILTGNSKKTDLYFKEYLKLQPGNSSAREDYGELLLSGKKPRESIKQFLILYKESTGNPYNKMKYLKKIGYIYSTMGDYKNSKIYYKKGLKLTSKNHWAQKELLNQLIIIAKKEKKIPKLIKEFLKKPDHYKYKLVANLYQEMEKFKLSKKYYKLAISKKPRNTSYRVEYIYFLEEIGVNENIILKEQEKLCKISKHNAKYCFDLAKKYFQMGKKKKCFTLLKKFHKSKDPATLFSLIEIYRTWNKNKKIKKLYKKLIKIEPLNLLNYVELGNLYWRLGQKNEALKIWGKLLKYKEGLFEYGKIQYNIGNYKLSEKYLKTVLKKEIKFEYIEMLGKVYDKQKKSGKTLQLYEKYLSSSKKNQNNILYEKLQYSLLDIWKKNNLLKSKLIVMEKTLNDIKTGLVIIKGYKILKDSLKVEKLYRKLHKKYPNHEEPILGLINLYSKLKLYKNLIKIINKAIILLPGRSKTFYFLLSKAWAKEGNYEKANEYLKLSKNSYSNNPEFWAVKGEYSRMTGEFDKAVEAYKKAISLSRKSVKYYLKLAEIYRRKGFLKKALTTYSRIFRISKDHATIFKVFKITFKLAKQTKHYEIIEKPLYLRYIRSSEKQIWSEMLTQVYEKFVPHLVKKQNILKHGKNFNKIQANFNKIKKRSIKPILDNLKSSIFWKTSLKIIVLYKDPDLAVPLMKKLKSLWTISVSKYKSRNNNNSSFSWSGFIKNRKSILNDSELLFYRKSVYTAGVIGNKQIVNQLDLFANQKHDKKLELISNWAISKVKSSGQISLKVLKPHISYLFVKSACEYLDNNKKYRKEFQLFDPELNSVEGCINAWKFTKKPKPTRTSLFSRSFKFFQFNNVNRKIKVKLAEKFLFGYKKQRYKIAKLLLSPNVYVLYAPRFLKYQALAMKGFYKSLYKIVLKNGRYLPRYLSMSSQQRKKILTSVKKKSQIAIQKSLTDLIKNSGRINYNCSQLNEAILALREPVKKVSVNNYGKTKKILNLWEKDFSIKPFTKLCGKVKSIKTGKYLLKAFSRKLYMLQKSKYMVIRVLVWRLYISSTQKTIPDLLGVEKSRIARKKVLKYLAKIKYISNYKCKILLPSAKSRIEKKLLKKLCKP
jgi:tetratricopeptide (TPR) repeat protein